MSTELKAQGIIQFERAIFTSWYCSLGDCTYCFMSVQKSKIDDPKAAKRKTASILAEAYLGKKLGWKIGFLSAGYGAYTPDSLVEQCKQITDIVGEKIWLNVGVLPEPTIKRLLPYVEGICGAVETTNEAVHKEVAPNKPIAPIETMYRVCETHNLKKAMTFIVGMGETIDDFPSLHAFIEKNKIDKITFYALNGIKGTVFQDNPGPTLEYYTEWMKKTRDAFPEIDMVAGMWVNRVDKIKDMIDAGCDAITKFPALKLFNTQHAKTVEDQIQQAGFSFEGTVTEMPEINLDEIDSLHLDQELKAEMKEKVTQYLKTMQKAAEKHQEKEMPLIED